MPVQRRNYRGMELLVSTSRDRLLVTFRLNDIARIVSMVGLRPLAVAACREDEVWEVPQVEEDVTMITLEGVRALLGTIGGDKATAFMKWADEEFPENTAVSALSDDPFLAENLYRLGEMRLENPDIQLEEIATRLSISEHAARGYLVYSDFVRDM